MPNIIFKMCNVHAKIPHHATNCGSQELQDQTRRLAQMTQFSQFAGTGNILNNIAPFF